MAERSVAASQKGLQQAEENLTDLRLSKVELAQKAGCARSTVVNFFAGKRVERQSFAAICKALNLDWKTVAGTSSSSLQATPQGIEMAKIALIGLRMNQGTLADRLEVSRQTISNFFTGKPVRNEIFVGICESLDLNWKIIANFIGPPAPNSEAIETDLGGSAPPELGVGGLPDIDTLVERTRSAVRPLIQEQCGTMRVLDMDQPIELTGDRGIYTNVNILEKQSRLRSEREMLEDCDFDNRRVRERQIPGLEAVEKHRRLMVLGKPGAGKTTFLKYLAMQCITGGSGADQVPFFVTLKDFAEAEKSPSLVNYLSLRSGLADVSPLLLAGRSLILLDGLDEVREEDTVRVIREMRDTADRFSTSQFVITCRIAAKEYTFERFTEVEVADFNPQQIATFAENWFRAKRDLPKAETFVARLKENEPIQELASRPLLLTLLCLVFGEDGDFSSNRADLYEEGVKILLKKWDAKRNIQRDKLYTKLDVQRREDLLSYLALQTFQQKEYFIKQRRLEGYIADFIRNLRDVDPEPESLRMDSEKMLKSIQAQHGLLVERARGIYSFSHLTFQEYFTAREIVETNQINLLVTQIAEKRWREVFLLTVGMMRNADELLLKMKQSIDSQLVNTTKPQQFVEWVNQKSLSVKVPYKPAVVRAFYFTLTGTLDLDRDLAFALDQNFKLAFPSNLDRMLKRALDHVLDYTHELDLAVVLDLAIAFNLDPISTLDLALALASDLDFKHQLQESKNRLPDTSWENRENFKKWWKTNGDKWTEDLRQITITHRNIGHDWQFTAAQKTLLQQYYDANLLLVECLNSDCYVSRSVREEIEATLLLPMEEIEKRRERKD